MNSSIHRFVVSATAVGTSTVIDIRRCTFPSIWFHSQQNVKDWISSLSRAHFMVATSENFAYEKCCAVKCGPANREYIWWISSLSSFLGSYASLRINSRGCLFWDGEIFHWRFSIHYFMPTIKSTRQKIILRVFPFGWINRETAQTNEEVEKLHQSSIYAGNGCAVSQPNRMVCPPRKSVSVLLCCACIANKSTLM